MFDLDTIFDETWRREEAAASSDLDDVEERLGYRFTAEFRALYEQTDGFCARIGDLYVDFWSLDEIPVTNDCYEEDIGGKYVLFASGNESSDGYAYEKESNRIFVFPIECGVEMEEKEFCADDLKGLFAYWRRNAE